MTAHTHTKWADLKLQRSMQTKPRFQHVGDRDWLENLHWRLVEDLFEIRNHTPDYPVVPEEILDDLSFRADELIWLVEYLKERSARPRPD